MRTISKLPLAKLTLAFAIPALLLAHKAGPDPAVNGDPSSNALSCSQANCHVGTALNGGGGSIAVKSSTGGTTYTPGVKQTFTLTITDTASTTKLYGFQASIRVQGTNVQAGNFTAVSGSNTFVQCSDGRTRTAATCPTSVPIEYIQHGPNPTTNRTGIFTFDWTAPATAVGPVILYFAGNAANGDLDNTGDHIYNGRLTLTAATATPKPVIGAAISAGAFGAFTTFTGGSWIEIYGSNLAATTRQWAGADFNGNQAPISLDNVSVTVNGRPAYVWVLVHDATNGDQLNVQVPTDGAISGNAQIVVTLNGQSSDPFTIIENATFAGGLLAPGAFKIGSTHFIAGVFPDLDANRQPIFALAPGAIAGISARLAKPGDLVTFYGVGFGETQNRVQAGTIAPANEKLLNSMTWQIGSSNATVQFGGLAPGSVGLYQFNVVIPAVVPGLYKITVRVGGSAVVQDLTLQIGQ